ncbi:MULTISPECIES: SDR family oxidoreductase [Streptomyces]|uniref:SDR family oxidoreductase n=1 Tax=Streptomyces TaxID=1883 RepID=UPI00163C3493|nr:MULTISPECIES: SDR family NAD(P)-dependent oxidoreductase [Streptomyces]MBC2877621.1 SDR family oxidoreductase [Streptomyces sp. TYQ1024]UBI36145.1 SDR family oxidoreductase [Streptomyces mobaraensis]UKW28740.1 SDR family oxidoreductase [Streptomyces sp. TYQ1024]
MTETRRTALIVGASRTLGLGIAAAYLRRGWDVVGTVRGTRRTGLHELADRAGTDTSGGRGRLTVESLEMTAPDQIAALRDRLAARSTTLDLLFVNAAITRGDLPIGEVPTDMFTEVMVTNALSPMRVVETLRPLVAPAGTIGVMSSDQGSVSLNTEGGQDLYRASKSALNQLMRCRAARHASDTRTLLLMDPGWVRTGLGGPEAELSVEESVPGVVETMEAHRGKQGLHFVDLEGNVVPW